MISEIMRLAADAAVVAAVVAVAILMTPLLVEIVALVLGWPEDGQDVEMTMTKEDQNRLAAQLRAWDAKWLRPYVPPELRNPGDPDWIDPEGE